MLQNTIDHLSKLKMEVSIQQFNELNSTEPLKILDPFRHIIPSKQTILLDNETKEVVIYIAAHCLTFKINRRGKLWIGRQTYDSNARLELKLHIYVKKLDGSTKFHPINVVLAGHDLVEQAEKTRGYHGYPLVVDIQDMENVEIIAQMMRVDGVECVDIDYEAMMPKCETIEVAAFDNKNVVVINKEYLKTVTNVSEGYGGLVMFEGPDNQYHVEKIGVQEFIEFLLVVYPFKKPIRSGFTLGSVYRISRFLNIHPMIHECEKILRYQSELARSFLAYQAGIIREDMVYYHLKTTRKYISRQLRFERDSIIY